MKSIKGVRWYHYLLPKENAVSLISSFPRSTLLNKFVVCWDHFDMVHQKTHKLYSCFDSYLQFVIYFLKLDLKFKCFYEIVFGENIQKPHFDVDIEVNECNNIDKEVLNNLLNAIFSLIPDINLEKDVCIYSSHGKKNNLYKFSYHVIINNYYHCNNEDAKAFYYNVMEKLPSEYFDNHWIDHAVYSKTQQFRIYGTKKNGTDRVKILNKIWELNGKTIVHINENDDEKDENLIFLSNLEESLVTARVSNCKPLPYFEVPEKYVKKNYEKGEDLEYDLAMEAIELLAHSLGTYSGSKSFPYKFDKIENSFIILKRLKASKCKLCNRIHYNENPYILVTNDKNVFFHCRRSTPDRKLYIGCLKSEEINEEKEEINEEEKEEINNSVWLEIKLKKLKNLANVNTSQYKKQKEEKEYKPGLVSNMLKE